jgi:hypothetical protein
MLPISNQELFKCGFYTIIISYNPYKIYSKIITQWINKTVKVVLFEQTGFRKGRPCKDNVFALKIVMGKRREFNKQLNIC